MRPLDSIRRHSAAALAIAAGLVLSPVNAWSQGATTPVTVTNPVTVGNAATNPALTSSVDDPGRIPYQARESLSCSGNSCQSGPTPAIPNGHRFVLRYITISGLATTKQANFVVNIVEIEPKVKFGFATIVQISGATTKLSSTEFLASINQQALFYLENRTLIAEVRASENFTFDSFLTGPIVTYTGYLLDCTAAPCAPIAP